MACVKAFIEIKIEVGYYAAGDSNSHPENVDKNKKLVFHQAAERDK